MLLDQRRVGGEPAEVGAGAEDLLPRSREDHGMDPIVVADPPHGVDELAEHLAGERVALLGAVERHRGDAVGDLVEKLLVIHRESGSETAWRDYQRTK